MRAILSDRLALNNLDVSHVYAMFVDKLGEEIGYGSYQSKIEFSRNVDGRREPKPLHVQRELLLNLISTLAADMARKGIRYESQTEDQMEESEVQEETQEVSETEETEETEVSEVSTNPVDTWLAKIREIRSEETRRSELESKRTPILEAVSGNRPAKNGARMLAQGIPMDALCHALALDWPAEARTRYGIREYDATTYRNGDAIPDNRHPLYAMFNSLAKARVPIALIGPSGTGKSTLCSQWAKDHDMSFGFVPMTAGATPGWLVGAYTLEGYRSRSAMDCYENGGVFVFEEMDAADPNMLLVANNLIENDVFDNPVTGEQIKRSPNFIPVACMNTRGLGATATNTGRSRLDDATRNRFALGRIELFLDEELESFIAHSEYKEFSHDNG
jgi:hypothetical protein